MKTDFISTIADQMRTPLTDIKWILNSFLSQELGGITVEQRKYLKRAFDSNEKVISLVNEILGNYPKNKIT